MAFGGINSLNTWGSGEDNAALVEQVKELRKANSQAQSQWAVYTDGHGGGTRDPSKHTAAFLQGFIDYMQSGQLMEVPESTENPTLAEAIKTVQKKSSNFKAVWGQYCTKKGGGRMDPSRHDSNFHMQFLEYMAGVVFNGGGGMGGDDGNPAKRMRTDMGGSGDPVKDQLVAMIKAYQRLGDEYRQVWSQYAETYLGGKMDPNRHDTATLQEFCTNHEVPQVPASAVQQAPQSMPTAPAMQIDQIAKPTAKAASPMPGMGGPIMPGMAMGSPAGMTPPSSMIGKLMMTAPKGMTAPQGMGMTAPQGMPGMKAMKTPTPGAGGAGAAAAMGMDAEKSNLVDRIKAYQKASPTNKETWLGFCGSTKDPARHQKDKLMEFCAAAGI